MKARSSAFDEAIKRSHTMAAKVDILQGGQVAVSDLLLVGGTVTLQSQTTHYGRANVTILDPSGNLTPRDFDDLLMPMGTEFRPYRGVIYDDGTSEFLQLGVYGIKTSRVSDTGSELKIQLTGYDRSRKINRARFTHTYQIPTNYVAGQAIEDILLMADPSVEFALDLSTALPGAMAAMTYERGDEPWVECQKIAKDQGANLYFNEFGQVSVYFEPTEEECACVWDYEEGPNCTMLYMDREIDNERLYNHVLVTGEPTDGSPPVWAEAYDDDPVSPTYIGGSYGDVLYTYTSPSIVTTEQAQAVANKLLREVLGALESLRITAIVHPAHDAYDAIRVYRPQIGVDGIHLLDKVTIPLDYSGSGDLQTRERRVYVGSSQG